MAHNGAHGKQKIKQSLSINNILRFGEAHQQLVELLILFIPISGSSDEWRFNPQLRTVETALLLWLWSGPPNIQN